VPTLPDNSTSSTLISSTTSTLLPPPSSVSSVWRPFQDEEDDQVRLVILSITIFSIFGNQYKCSLSQSEPIDIVLTTDTIVPPSPIASTTSVPPPTSVLSKSNLTYSASSSSIASSPTDEQIDADITIIGSDKEDENSDEDWRPKASCTSNRASRKRSSSQASRTSNVSRSSRATQASKASRYTYTPKLKSTFGGPKKASSWFRYPHYFLYSAINYEDIDLLIIYSITLIPFSNTGEEIIKAKRTLARKLRGVAKLFAIGAEHLVSSNIISVIYCINM
jgi:hypothetical protein